MMKVVLPFTFIYHLCLEVGKSLVVTFQRNIVMDNLHCWHLLNDVVLPVSVFSGVF